MSRDSRLWQNSLAAGIVFEGDQVEALKWVNWAKVKLGFMLQSTPGATSGTFAPEEGVTIRIDTRPNRISISVRNTIYMESGFLLLGTTAKCHPDTFIPAKIHLDAATNANIAAYLLSSNTPLEGLAELDNTGDYPDFPIWAPPNDAPDAPYFGKGLVHNDPSKTMGGNKLSTFVQDLCGNTYEQVNPTYGDQDMYLQKACQRYVPSSLYSGKLRLFIQSLYGSIRTDYKIRLWGDSNLPASYDYKLVLVNEDNSETTFEHGLPTTGLFTTEDYEYFLMECSVSSITFRKLRLSKVAMGWLKVLKTHPLRTVKFFANRVEAYALSTARIDLNKPAITLPTKVPSGAAGGPMGYGFKFKWDGSEIKIILHELDGYEYGINISRTVTVKITYDKNAGDTLDKQFTVAGGMSNTSIWTNGIPFQIWSPDWFNLQWNSFGAKLGGHRNTTGTPMYGYYDQSDTWTEIGVFHNLSTQALNEALPPVSASTFPGYGLDDPVGQEGEFDVCTNQFVGTYGYYIGGVQISFKHRLNTNRTIHQQSYVYRNIAAEDTLLGVGDTINNPPFGWYDSQCPTTLEYGFLNDYLLTKYPDLGLPFGGNVNVYYYRTGSPSYIKYNIEGYSNSFPSNDTCEAYSGTTDNLSVSGRLIWGNTETYTDLDESTAIMLGLPLNDSEAIFHGSHTLTQWASKRQGQAWHKCYLKQLVAYRYDTLYYYNVNPGASYHRVTAVETLNAKQLINSNYGAATGYDWNSYTDTGAASKTSTKIYQSASSINGYTFINTGGPITNAILLRQEDKPSSSYPSWAQQFFMKAAPYPDLSDYHPVVFSKSSTGGATLVNMDFGAFSYGYPASGVYSAIGWV